MPQNINFFLKKSFVLALFFLSFFCVSSAISQETTYTSLAANTFSSQTADVDGNLIVWEGRVSFFGVSQIFLYDLTLK